MFCFVHGIFVFTLLGDRRMASDNPIEMGSEMLSDIFAHGKWVAIALVVSHFISYIYNFFLKGEYQRTFPPKLMAAPYGRIVVLHIAILLGAFGIEALGSPLYLLILLVLGKTMLDYKMHQRSHRKAQEI